MENIIQQTKTEGEEKIRASKSKTKDINSPSATLGNKSKSKTEGWESPSATLGNKSKSKTKGRKSYSTTLGNNSKSKTKGEQAHSATFEEKSHSYTEGDGAYSVTLGSYSLSETKGENAITSAYGYMSIVKAHHGLVSIVEYKLKKEELVPKKTHSAQVGEKILDVTIEPDKPYGFDEKGTFREFTEEEVLEILNPYLKKLKS